VIAGISLIILVFLIPNVVFLESDGLGGDLLPYIIFFALPMVIWCIALIIWGIVKIVKTREN